MFVAGEALGQNINHISNVEKVQAVLKMFISKSTKMHDYSGMPPIEV